MQSIFIEAREWFDKTGGNSYFSARISVDGELVGYLPLQYGYESAYEYEATKWLVANGYITERVAPLWQLKQDGVHVYTVKYPATKRDAVRFGKTWQEVAA